MFLSIGLIWGSSFLLIAIGLDAFEPGLVTWLRIIFGASVLWLVPAARRRCDREDFPRLVAISVLWVAIPFTLFPLAEQQIALRRDRSGERRPPDLRGGVRLDDAPARARTDAGARARRRLPGIVAIALPSISEGSSEAIGFAHGARSPSSVTASPSTSSRR